jgi:Icc-related predicted phosphoesterase
VFVSHAPPWKMNDQDDLPHQGIKAFVWFNRRFQPAYHLHGHVHLYRQDAIRVVQYGKTRIVNTCGFQVIDLP